MKKIMGLLLVAMFAIGMAGSASAAGTVTTAEKGIITALGGTAKGVHIPQDYIVQAESTVAKKDISDANAAAITANINKAFALVEASDAKGSNFTEVWGSLDKATKDQILALVAASDELLEAAPQDIKADPLTKKTGQKDAPASKAGIIKTTGANYTTSFAVFAGLMIAAFGVAVIGKKYANVA